MGRYFAPMAITEDEVIALVERFHDVSMLEKGDAAAQAAFFLHPSTGRTARC